MASLASEQISVSRARLRRAAKRFHPWHADLFGSFCSHCDRRRHALSYV